MYRWRTPSTIYRYLCLVWSRKMFTVRMSMVEPLKYSKKEVLQNSYEFFKNFQGGEIDNCHKYLYSHPYIYCNRGNYKEVLFIAFITSRSATLSKTFILVIWSLASLYVTHPNPLLLQPVSFALTYKRYTLGRNQYHVYSSSMPFCDAVLTRMWWYSLSYLSTCQSTRPVNLRGWEYWRFSSFSELWLKPYPYPYPLQLQFCHIGAQLSKL